ncbi:MAG: hypothetical protein ACOCRX_07660, partial [Candidatus Woesearchaeota archaeon]
VKSSTGLITQNKYDGNVSLDINVNYPPTELKVDRGFRKNYTFDPEKQYNSEKSNYDWIKGFFGIENIGNNTAYGVKIGVEGVDENWIDSDTNDFKLNQDSIKDIYPELKPQIYSTNKTNQTYNLNITIKGENTPEIKREVNVYVPYDEIEGEDFDDGKSPIERILEDRFDLEEFLEFCEQNPDHEACGGSDRFLVKDSEDDSFNVTYYKSQVDRFNRMFVNEIRKDNKNTNILKEEVQDMKGWQNTSDEESSEIKSLLEETLEQNNKWMSFIQFLTILIISLITFGILGVVIWMLRKKNKLPSFKIAREWQKIKNKNK